MTNNTSKVFENLTSLLVVVVLMAGSVAAWGLWKDSKQKSNEPTKQVMAMCADTKDIVMKQMCSE